MLKPVYFSLVAMLTILTGCVKTNQHVDELKKKSDVYQASIIGNRYQLVEFYSDKPIDYIESDTVIKKETALWTYVKPYLTDDENGIYGKGEIIINQKSSRYPLIDSAYIYRSYKFSNDDKAIYFDFIDYFYKPLKYTVSSMDRSSILIYINWPNGAKLYSRYKRIL